MTVFIQIFIESSKNSVYYYVLIVLIKPARSPAFKKSWNPKPLRYLKDEWDAHFLRNLKSRHNRILLWVNCCVVMVYQERTKFKHLFAVNVDFWSV